MLTKRHRNMAEAGTPAAYRVSVGGSPQIREEAACEAGYCHLPCGRVVEEWALFWAQRGG